VITHPSMLPSWVLLLGLGFRVYSNLFI
jgi:hypothetical protein